jgi:CrcB protein
VTLPLWLAVGALGSVGAIARFLLDGFVAERAGDGLPWGTFAVNISGALVLGVLVGAALHGEALVLAGTATIGSYTTFSTWIFETHRLGEEGRLRFAALNVVGSLAVGFGAVELGQLIGGLL